MSYTSILTTSFNRKVIIATDISVNNFVDKFLNKTELGKLGKISAICKYIELKLKRKI